MTPATVSLCQLKNQQKAIITTLDCDPVLLQRLYEFGVFVGETIEYLQAAPLGDPIEFRVGDTRLSLRKIEAAKILVQPLS